MTITNSRQAAALQALGVSGMAGWIVLSLLGLLAVCGVSADYYIGAGRYDITGPAAEVEMVRDTFTRR